MESLEIKTVFSFTFAGREIPVTETVIVTWVVMIILIAGSMLLTRRLRQIPEGPQAILEAGIEFLNNFAKNQFGRFAEYLGPYMGSVFLFIVFNTIISVFTPVHLHVFGHEFVPPFSIRPPTKDINVTAALAAISISLVLITGLAARGIKGWLKNFLHPVPLMLPFNILDYGTRFLSLTLRLFGNILGGFVMMGLIEGILPVGLPMIFSLYFDFFDGVLQAAIFVFLTSLYISEAVKVHE